MRSFYFICGFFTLGLGMIGIFLPLLPTTPLVLLSAFCFARSSEKFHRRLLNHPRFGKAIKDWQEQRSISKKGKICAVIMMAFSLVISFILHVPGLILTIQIIALGCVSLFILTRPNSK